MQSQHVCTNSLWILADQSEFTELRNTLPTNITPALGSAVGLTENGSQLCGADFSSVSLDNCLFSVLPTARLWCLMKLLPQWHVTSEVTEGLPQWGQSVWDNCFFTIGLTFMVLWLTVSKTAVILTWSSTSVASHDVQACPHLPHVQRLWFLIWFSAFNSPDLLCYTLKYLSYSNCLWSGAKCFTCTQINHVFPVFFLQSLGLAHFIWITPLQCILCVGLIWELIEVNGFCALAALTLLGIIQAWLSQKMGPHRWGNTTLPCISLRIYKAQASCTVSSG